MCNCHCTTRQLIYILFLNVLFQRLILDFCFLLFVFKGMSLKKNTFFFLVSRDLQHLSVCQAYNWVNNTNFNGNEVHLLQMSVFYMFAPFLQQRRFP